MSEEIAEEAFRSAGEEVDKVHQQAVEETRAKVQKAKSEALGKLSS